MAEPERTVDERGCPRRVGSADGQLVTCGHAHPCPYHGDGGKRHLEPVPDRPDGEGSE